MSIALKILLLLTLLANGCRNHAGQEATETRILESPPANRTSTQLPRSLENQTDSIRKIDFSNFTYDWYPKWDYMLTESKHFSLREGKLDVDVPKGSNEPALFKLQNVQYGDLTQDGLDEAVVAIRMEVWGSSTNPYVIFVYSLASDKPRRIWTHETGDRADEGLRDVYIGDAQLLVIEQYNASEVAAPSGEKTKVGMCCPPTFTRTFYRWHEGRFQTLRKETLRNEHPDARVLVGLGRSKS